MTKTCTKCKTEYPATAEFFYRGKKYKNGLQSWCKVCMKAYRESWEKQYQQTLNGYLRGVFSNIKGRCSNPEHKWYRIYGGRGIENRFVDFRHFMQYIVIGLCVTDIDQLKGLQIDRIDNDGHYEPGNIRFTTAKVNSNNRNNRKVKL